jgi:hypothetical protein
LRALLCPSPEIVYSDPIHSYAVVLLAHSGLPRSTKKAPLLNSAKMDLTLPSLLISKTSIPLTFSLSLPAPLIVIQREAILLQLLKVSRTSRYSGGCAPDPAMKASLLEKVTDPSYCHTRQLVKQFRCNQNIKGV